MNGILHLTEKIAALATDLYIKYEHVELVYHNLYHTKQVVAHTEEMIDFYQLNNNDRVIVFAAAWFHDTGQLFGKSNGHEQLGISIMEECLRPLIWDNNIITSIGDCIRATQRSVEPTNLPEQILCDADTYHLGTSEFLVTDELVKKEMVLREGIHTDNWDAKTLELLQRHQFYTSYCRQKLTAGKSINIALLQKRLVSNHK